MIYIRGRCLKLNEYSAKTSNPLTKIALNDNTKMTVHNFENYLI